MFDDDRIRVDPVGDFGRAFDRRVNDASASFHNRVAAAKRWALGRPLTIGEIREIRWMFGSVGGIQRATVYPRNYWWPFSNNRAMTPSGDIYFPHQDFRDDFSVADVPVRLSTLFMHEATHLYQWYVLGIPVILRGIRDRNYDYELVPGRPLKEYGIEQMGQIVEDYFTLRHGGIVRDQPYRWQDYSAALPIRPR